MNLFLDKDGLIKVKCKFDRFKEHVKFPVLLPKHSKITTLIIRDAHEKHSHIGCYSLISRIRRDFWIEHVFSSVKNVLKDCIICRRFNNRAVKLNQNSYRDFRTNPPSYPFRYIFIDYLGPFTI